MRSKLAVRVLAAALLAALLHLPAHAAPGRGLSWSRAASWWDWLEQGPLKVLLRPGKQGSGWDPSGVPRKEGSAWPPTAWPSLPRPRLPAGV